MATFEVPGAVLDHELAGESGTPVVQLHGLTSSRARDAEVGLDLGRALPGRRVLRYDARGHGGSTGRAVPEDYTWPRLAEDLLRLLDHVLPGERVHGVGPSMGSATLLHAAVRDPGRFAGLTLLVPPTAWATRRAQAAGYLAGADLVERHGLAAFVERGSAAPVPPALSDSPRTGPSVPEHLVPSVLRGAASSDLPGSDELATITVPTLIMAWSRDPAHPVGTATALHDIIPGSRLVLARSAHGMRGWPGLFAEHVGETG